MFTAKLENGTIISVIDHWHLDELKALRKKRSFHCPMCTEQVQLKLGFKRHWHFAHPPNSKCERLYERETMYHLNGKKQLYEWLKQQKVEVALEVYLPLIRQRPDLLLRHQKKLYALEYQCSPIDPLILANRTNGYYQLGITPIWILGGNRLKRHSTETFSLKAFEWYATRQNTMKQPYLTYYCSNTQNLSNLEQLIPYTPTRLLAKYEEHPLQSLDLNNLLHPPKQKKHPHDQWLIIKKHWRYRQPSPYPSRTDLLLQQILYQKKIPPNLFPIEAGWPTANHYLIESSPYQWQTFILLECIQYQPLYHFFSARIIKKCLQSYINKRLFVHRQTLEEFDWSLAVDGYLKWLCQVNYLEEGKEQDLYKRVRDMTLPTSTEQAIEFDRKCLYRTLISKNNPEKVRHNKGILNRKSNV